MPRAVPLRWGAEGSPDHSLTGAERSGQQASWCWHPSRQPVLLLHCDSAKQRGGGGDDGDGRDGRKQRGPAGCCAAPGGAAGSAGWTRGRTKPGPGSSHGRGRGPQHPHAAHLGRAQRAHACPHPAHPRGAGAGQGAEPGGDPAGGSRAGAPHRRALDQGQRGGGLLLLLRGLPPLRRPQGPQPGDHPRQDHPLHPQRPPHLPGLLHAPPALARHPAGCAARRKPPPGPVAPCGLSWA